MIARWKHEAARLILPLLMGCLWATQAAAQVTVRDVEGNEVVLDKPAAHIVLAEGRQLMALSLLSDDPVSFLAGWGSDLKRSKALYALYQQRFPELDNVKVVGDGPGPHGISAETVLSLNPDAVVLSRSQTPPEQSAELLAQLKAAGIPVVYIDFATDPLHDTVPSLRALGQLIGADDRAERYIAFYEAASSEIQHKVEEAGDKLKKPDVMIEAHAGGMNDCCYSPGQGSFESFINVLHASSIGADVLKKKSGKLDPQYILMRDPDVYIATGGSYLEGTGGLVLGPGYSEQRARASLEKVMQRSLIAELSAVTDGKVHGLFHHLINTPYNILVLEVMAKWLHPDLFKEVDPQQTLTTINNKYSSVALSGALWVDLKAADAK
ncbi:ABC transporter substrate-binding protein [Phytohalomonas tamaricis]|uniref:ABC transporter substrate-binding protein n=1 Tax=Phytohalomonas tamaricis TaxID=2081032 RepID=UPI000D0B3F55|nr:ABC transporter substrate-binding protein [Phytohalomonas tamaricis]